MAPAAPPDDDDEDLCRICFSGRAAGALVSPCLCKGSQKRAGSVPPRRASRRTIALWVESESLRFVHEACLRQWQAACKGERAARFCAVCRGKFSLAPRESWWDRWVTEGLALHAGLATLAVSLFGRPGAVGAAAAVASGAECALGVSRCCCLDAREEALSKWCGREDSHGRSSTRVEEAQSEWCRLGARRGRPARAPPPARSSWPWPRGACGRRKFWAGSWAAYFCFL